MSNLNSTKSKNINLRTLVLAAMFCAIAYVATLLTAWIEVAGFLSFDMKDTIITIAGLILGPIYSLVISFVVSLIEIIVNPKTGPWGFLMNFLSTAAFSCVCSLIYKYKKNMKGAAIGLSVAAISTTAIMMPLNLLITPLYTGMPVEAIAEKIPVLLLPFNFAKSVLNAALVLVLYKPISRALKAAKIIPAKESMITLAKPKNKVWQNVTVYGIGTVLIIASLLIFFIALGGEFVPFWK